MQKKLMFWLPICSYILLLVYISLFKVGNTDFWWHIKAGQVLRDMGWITTDVFAYTREGLAYLASHEWLAQIVLSLAWDAGGVLGITTLRILSILLTFGLPIVLHRKNMWINGALAVLAAAGARPAFTDRPQLFSFLMFSIIVCLCIAYLEADSKTRKRILLYFPFAIIVWSNLHGAAALVGVGVIGFLMIDRILTNFQTSELKWFAALTPALILALLITPSGIGNISYIIHLLTDNTANVISEWQPAAWNIYLQHTLPLWVASVLAIVATRRHLFFSAGTVLLFGYLSRTAVRHEPLFIIAALAITVYQLRYNEWWNAVLSRVYKNTMHFYILCILCTLCALIFSYIRTYDVNRVDNLFGFGIHEPMRSAYQFIEEHNIEGPMFNNYNAGGELLYRGYPERKVFIDGRNIDYGYDFLMDAINAGVDESVWKKLEDTYQFTHAVIYYDIQAEQNPIPFTDLLDTMENWNLVYIDDWAAVYIRAESQELKAEISFITPKILHRQAMPKQMSTEEFDRLQNELDQIITWAPDGVKARLYLARLYMLLGAYEPAAILLEDAKDAQSNNYLVYVGMSQLSMEKGDWPLAAYYLKKAKRKAGFSGVQIDSALLSTIEGRAVGN